MTRRAAFALVAAAIALAACSQPPVPEDHYYRIGVAAPHARPKPMAGTIEVERFIADGVVADRPIVYSDRGNAHEVQAYHYQFWVEPPTVMLQNQLVSYLRAANVAKRIVTPELRTEPDYIVTGKIIRFEQVRGDPPGTTVELELALKQSGDDRVLVLESRKIETRAANNSVPAAVAAISQAVTTLFQEFVARLPR
jgi:ABC-type uncharacterized transport system auxiliary subunit